MWDEASGRWHALICLLERPFWLLSRGQFVELEGESELLQHVSCVKMPSYRVVIVGGDS